MNEKHECACGEIGFLVGSDSPPGVLQLGWIVLDRVLGALQRLATPACEQHECLIPSRQFYPELLLEVVDDQFLTRVPSDSAVSKQ